MPVHNESLISYQGLFTGGMITAAALSEAAKSTTIENALNPIIAATAGTFIFLQSLTPSSDSLKETTWNVLCNAGTSGVISTSLAALSQTNIPCTAYSVVKSFVTTTGKDVVSETFNQGLALIQRNPVFCVVPLTFAFTTACLLNQSLNKKNYEIEDELRTLNITINKSLFPKDAKSFDVTQQSKILLDILAKWKELSKSNQLITKEATQDVYNSVKNNLSSLLNNLIDQNPNREIRYLALGYCFEHGFKPYDKSETAASYCFERAADLKNAVASLVLYSKRASGQLEIQISEDEKRLIEGLIKDPT